MASNKVKQKCSVILGNGAGCKAPVYAVEPDSSMKYCYQHYLQVLTGVAISTDMYGQVDTPPILEAK